MGKTAVKYIAYGTLILVLTGVATAVVGHLLTGTLVMAYNAISFIFQLVLIVAFGIAWDKVAKSSPKNLTVLYMSASGLRILLAAILLLVYMFVNRGKESLTLFSAIFAVYYLIFLIYDTTFFVSVEKKQLR